MTEFVVIRPFGEPDLGDKLGLDPMNAAPGQAAAGKRGSFDLKPSKLLAQAREHFGIKSGPDLACIYQLFPPVEADQQRSEADPAPFRVSVADDDELLLFRALEFQPVARPPGYICAVAVFWRYTFPSSPACMSIVALPLLFPILSESQGGAKLECVAKKLLPIP